MATGPVMSVAAIRPRRMTSTSTLSQSARPAHTPMILARLWLTTKRSFIVGYPCTSGVSGDGQRSGGRDEQHRGEESTGEADCELAAVDEREGHCCYSLLRTPDWARQIQCRERAK